MKRIVDIPDEVLESKHYCQYFGAWSTKLTELIEQSKPYDDSGDLISREALKEAIKDNGYSHYFEIFDIIDNAPTVHPLIKPIAEIKVEARPQGEWKTVDGYDGDEYYECSNCGEPWFLSAGTPKDNNMNFCPNCGAEMKGGAE